MIGIVSMSIMMFATSAAVESDPYVWLEEITGKRALEFVEAQNAVTVKELELQPDFGEFKSQVLAILNSHDRIPFVHKLGDRYYNFWQDAANPRGLLRPTAKLF